MNVLPLLRRALLPLTVAGVLAIGLFATEKDASARVRGPAYAAHHPAASHGWYGRGYAWHPRDAYWGRSWVHPGYAAVRRHGR